MLSVLDQSDGLLRENQYLGAWEEKIALLYSEREGKYHSIAYLIPNDFCIGITMDLLHSLHDIENTEDSKFFSLLRCYFSVLYLM